MKGQGTKRDRPALAAACRNSRGTPPYSTQRQQHAESQQDNAEASPTVPEGGRALSISEQFVDGYVIQEGHTAANYAAPTTTSVVGQEISTYYSISSDVVIPSKPPYPGAVEELDQPCALALARASKGYAPDLRFLAPTELKNGTPAAATYVVFLTPENKEPAASWYGKNEVPSTPDTAATAVSVVRDPVVRQQHLLAAAPQDGNSPEKWTVEEVARFVAGVPGCERYAKKFRDRKIDGDALFRMKEHHLTMVMNMNLGPALKLCATIDSQ
ncbi:hypothetical protein HPB50_020468 [Hyalomma asiaticum]|uniref:Uncharacterized protein n=1 Tax=Hyalomma asiaticum TaxID=266040 RepID=A0ACB7RMT6_HYAAI|nr:hypothetical protein HPB50_020468 [Hyalomma asiaticum]